MAGKWTDLTSQVDAVLGQLPPDEVAAIQSATSSKTMNAPDYQNQWSHAYDLLLSHGFTPEKAQALLQLTQNVKVRGNNVIGDMFDGSAGLAGLKKVLGDNLESDAGGAFRAAFGLKNADEQAAADAEQITADKAAKAKADLTTQIQGFVDSMLGKVDPVTGQRVGADPNDPVRLSLLQAGTDAAQMSAAQGGLSGDSTLAGTQAASVAQQNLAPYEAQKKSLGLQGLSLLNQRDIGLGQLQQGWAGLDQGQQNISNAAADAKWAGEQNQRQAIGSAIGGTLGTVAGAYFGMPSLGQAGASLGGGIGGATGPSSPSYTQPKSLGAGTSAGKGTSRGFGGS